MIKEEESVLSITTERDPQIQGASLSIAEDDEGYSKNSLKSTVAPRMKSKLWALCGTETLIT